MISIARFLPRSVPLLLGPLFLLAAFTLLSMQGVVPLYSLAILASGLLLAALLGVYALAIIIPLTGVMFYQLLPLDLWTVGLFSAVSLAFVQTALADSMPDAELVEKEELLKERYTHTLHEKEALNLELDKQLIQSLELGKLKLEVDSQEKVLELARLEVTALLKEKEEVQKERASLEINLAKLEEKLFEAESVKEALKESNQALREKTETVKELQAKISELESSYPDQEAIKQAIIQEMAEHIESLEKEKSLLESTLSKLQGELDDTRNLNDNIIETLKKELEETKKASVNTLQLLKKELEEAKNPSFENIEVNPAHFSKLQGMYKQLREQFEEKTLLLDQTRKELFHTSEKAEVLQREIAELQLQGRGLPELLEQLNNLDSHKTNLEAEIVRLEELISNLISRK